MKYEQLGDNIQAIRKMKGFTQHDLSEKIGINLQSLSKIERGVNYPTYETLEKIMDVLEVSPNELLSGELKTSSHMQSKILAFLEKEEELSVELAYGPFSGFLDKDEFKDYEMEKLREYISNYINSEKRVATDLYPIKELVHNLKFRKLLARYDDYLCHDLFSETIGGNKNPNPYGREVIESHYVEEDGTVTKTIEYPDDFDD